MAECHDDDADVYEPREDAQHAQLPKPEGLDDEPHGHYQGDHREPCRDGRKLGCCGDDDVADEAHHRPFRLSIVGRSFLDEKPQGDEKSDGRETDDVRHDFTSPLNSRCCEDSHHRLYRFYLAENMTDSDCFVKIL